jgi:hypothetical protein
MSAVYRYITKLSIDPNPEVHDDPMSAIDLRLILMGSDPDFLYYSKNGFESINEGIDICTKTIAKYSSIASHLTGNRDEDAVSIIDQDWYLNKQLVWEYCNRRNSISKDYIDDVFETNKQSIKTLYRDTFNQTTDDIRAGGYV